MLLICNFIRVVKHSSKLFVHRRERKKERNKKVNEIDIYIVKQSKIWATLEIVTISVTTKNITVRFFSFVSLIFLSVRFVFVSLYHFLNFFRLVAPDDHPKINITDCCANRKSNWKRKKLVLNDEIRQQLLEHCVIWNKDQFSDDILRDEGRKKSTPIRRKNGCECEKEKNIGHRMKTTTA